MERDEDRLLSYTTLHMNFNTAIYSTCGRANSCADTEGIKSVASLHVAY